MFEIRVEKNHELPEDDPRIKHKGRIVFSGDRVKDQIYEAAMFKEMCSCPATMETAKCADFLSVVWSQRTAG